ncbi:MAG: hypothetical protein GY797_21070 [Deltaproteobacteria bacterium]|nr:hypothetical protein [Deltaproteobacteria bacterium]
MTRRSGSLKPMLYAALFSTLINRSQCIGTKDKNGVSIPVPHAYFKSVLTENSGGSLHMWSFVIANKNSNKPLSSFQVPVTKIEKMSGLLLWERLIGKRIEREKSKVRKMW